MRSVGRVGGSMGGWGAPQRRATRGATVGRLLGMVCAAAVVATGCATTSVTRHDDNAIRVVEQAAAAQAVEGAGRVQPKASGPVVSAAVIRWRRSWNPHVACRAQLTTLDKVLGSRQNARGGATYRGGGFKPGIPDRRSFHPPCNVDGHHTFVQLNAIRIGRCAKINDDGDWTCTLFDPTPPAGRPASLNHIHIETDQKFRAAGGWSVPPGYTRLRVQGFVFWDRGHTEDGWHFYSGWELHSFTAWRPAVH